MTGVITQIQSKNQQQQKFANIFLFVCSVLLKFLSQPLITKIQLEKFIWKKTINIITSRYVTKEGIKA